MAQVKQDHDQKPNANLMLSVNMGGLGHQVKLESDCDTGNMQMHMHNTSDEVSIKLIKIYPKFAITKWNRFFFR